MKRLAGAVAIGAVLRLPLGEPASFVTVRQADAQRSPADSASAAISGDGRFVAFASLLQLVPEDTNRQRDIYVLDRSDGRVTLELSPDPRSVAHGDSDYPAINSDGRWLAYNWLDKVAVRDRLEHHATIVAPGRLPAISADGRFVAFTSGDVGLTDRPDANGTGEDVYVAEVSTGRIERISLDGEGRQPATGSSIAPSISGDGRLVAFSSTAPLSRGATGKVSRVYVRDRQAGTTRLVAAGWRPVISADGGSVAFVSADRSLAANDDNGFPDVFVADLHSFRIELISRGPSGRSASGSSVNPALSRDGRFVAFQSDAGDLGCERACPRALEDINLLWDIFVVDRRSHATVRISRDPTTSWIEESITPAIDDAGATLVFSSRHPIDADDKTNDFDLFILRR